MVYNPQQDIKKEKQFTNRNRHRLNKILFSFFPQLTKLKWIFDLTRQKQGIDTIVVCGGEEYYIDWKFDFRHATTNNFALEVECNNKVSWALKPKTTTHFLFLSPHTKRYYLLPAKSVRELAEQDYDIKLIKNTGYSAKIKPVPEKDIKKYAIKTK